MTDFMAEALKEAEKAYKKDEVPIGCVIVRNGEIVARSHNSKISDNDSTAHAEMKALKKAQKKLNTKYLYECEMFVTLEPCAMCAGAIVNTRLGTLHYALKEPKSGCCGSVYNLVDGKFNHTTKVIEGERKDEALFLMQEFFKEKRSNK